MLKYLTFWGVALNIYCTWIYLRDVWAGHARPNAVSWFMWGLTPLIGAFAALSKGATWATIPVFGSGLICLAVFVTCLFNKNAYWKLGVFDFLCGGLSVAALVAWQLTLEPLWAIVLAVLSDFMASLPTYIKAWNAPDTESVPTYLAGILNALTALAAAKSGSLSELLFPSYLLLGGITICIPLYRQRIRQRLVTAHKTEASSRH
jgi:hypothetical protein